MSVIGINPQRDKKAHRIIYGGFSAMMSSISIIAACMGHPIPTGAKIGAYYNKKRAQENAWKIYCATGSIKKAVKSLLLD